jgi:general L-amino acid transport system substrate-binding protein
MRLKKILSAILATACIGLGTAHAADSRLDTVKQRGALKCSGHNGSFLGFAEVDDKGAWKGLDIELCRALSAALFGKPEGHLEIVPISWAQRWPAVQSGDIDVVIKVTAWLQSRDTDLHMAFSTPYFFGAIQILTRKELNAKDITGLNGGVICVGAGTSQEKTLSSYLASKNVKAEVVSYEKFEEMQAAYNNKRCDGFVDWEPSLAIVKMQASNPDEHIILPEVMSLQPESIVLPEGDAKWLDVQNWMLSSLLFAEQQGITKDNVDQFRDKPPTAEVEKFLGKTPGYGTRLGLSDDWAFNMIKSVGNYGEIFERTLGQASPYKLKRGLNALYNNGGILYPLIID